MRHDGNLITFLNRFNRFNTFTVKHENRFFLLYDIKIVLKSRFFLGVKMHTILLYIRNAVLEIIT